MEPLDDLGPDRWAQATDEVGDQLLLRCRLDEGCELLRVELAGRQLLHDAPYRRVGGAVTVDKVGAVQQVL